MTEYEAQVLDVNVKQMRDRLVNLNGKKVHKNIKLIRDAGTVNSTVDIFAGTTGTDIEDTYVSEIPNIRGFARVRYDGKETTMTVKIYKNLKFPEET